MMAWLLLLWFVLCRPSQYVESCKRNPRVGWRKVLACNCFTSDLILKFPQNTFHCVLPLVWRFVLPWCLESTPESGSHCFEFFNVAPWFFRYFSGKHAGTCQNQRRVVNACVLKGRDRAQSVQLANKLFDLLESELSMLCYQSMHLYRQFCNRFTLIVYLTLRLVGKFM
jgi:hypothetical protein